MKLALLGIRFFLGALLLYSGLGEIRHPFDFLASVQAYQLTGPVSGIVVSAMVPWLEVVVGVCLIAGLFIRGAFAGAILLTCLFCFAITSAWTRGLGISCGCFGGGADAGGDLIGAATVLRSVALLGSAAAGTALCRADDAPSPARISLSVCPSRIRRGANFFSFHVPKTRVRPQSSGKATVL